MACPHHPGKAYVLKNGKLICPECGYVSPHQPLPSYDELAKRVIELERFLEDFCESANTKTDFQKWAERLMKKRTL